MRPENLLDRRPALRWLVPGVALATIAGVAVLRPAVAGASTGLEPLTAKELLVKAQQAEPVPMSGTVRQRFDLGLPELPRGMGGHPGSASLASLVSGTHTWRVWYGGERQARLALIGQSSESDIILNDRDLWVWSSSENTARQYVLPAGHTEQRSGASPGKPTAPTEAQRQAHRDALIAQGLPDPADPGAVADWALSQVEPTTAVEITSLDKVAGRSVYGLVLTPKGSNTLVASVRVAFDGETFLPLAVQVNSTKLDKPAIDVSFTDVSFDKPANSVFEFTPPPGTDVTRTDLSDKATKSPMRKAPGHGSRPEAPSNRAKDASPYRPVVSGAGWGTVVAGRLPTSRQPGSSSDAAGSSPQSVREFTRLLPEMPGGGGRVLDGTLFSVVLTDDGRYAVGAVPPEALYPALPKR